MLGVERVSESFFEEPIPIPVPDRSVKNNNNTLDFDSSTLTGGCLCSCDLEVKMPVDFAAYLLSSSPPGFSLFSNVNANAFSHCNVMLAPLKPVLSNTSSYEVASGSPLKSSSPICVCYTCRTQLHKNGQLQDNPFFLTSVDLDGCDETRDGVVNLSDCCRRLSMESDEEVLESIPIAKPKIKRRVTFADCKGYSLTEVRQMTESSDMPPDIRPQLLASLTEGASASVMGVSPLKLDFTQPASDYYAFREKLKMQSCCLENVILKDYTVLGTVKVKNLSFEKSVHVRVSFDSWKTYKEIKAVYVPSGDEVALQYDTFSFEIQIPSVLRNEQHVEFCVHYQCEAGEFWDSNSGKNYRIVAVNYNAPCATLYTADFRPNFSDVEIWSEYSAWHMLDNNDPYY